MTQDKMMRSTNPLPFKLVNPDTGEPLLREADVLHGLDRPALVIEMERCQIINFHPDCDVRNGFYYDSQNELLADRLCSTGNAHRSCYKTKSMRRVIAMAKPESIIVDLGCNDGQVLSCFPKNSCRIGVDISCESLFSHTPNALDSGVQHIWIANAMRLPIPGAVVDMVLCCDIIEHMLEPESILKEAHRILKPGGVLFVSVPNLTHLANRLSMLWGFGGGIELAQILKWKSPFVAVSGVLFPDQRMHLRWFTSSSLTRCVSGLGFEVMERLGIGPIASRLPMPSFSRSLALQTAIVAKKH